MCSQPLFVQVSESPKLPIVTDSAISPSLNPTLPAAHTWNLNSSVQDWDFPEILPRFSPLYRSTGSYRRDDTLNSSHLLISLHYIIVMPPSLSSVSSDSVTSIPSFCSVISPSVLLNPSFPAGTTEVPNPEAPPSSSTWRQNSTGPHTQVSGLPRAESLLQR